MTRHTLYMIHVLSQTVEKNFSVRIINNCRELGINTIFELLIKMKDKDPDFIRIFGKKSKVEIKKKLLKNGINVEDIIIDENFKKHFCYQKAIYSNRIIKN